MQTCEPLFITRYRQTCIFPLCFPASRAAPVEKCTSPAFDSIMRGFLSELANAPKSAGASSSARAEPSVTSFRRHGAALEEIANTFGRSFCSSTACVGGMASTLSCLLLPFYLSLWFWRYSVSMRFGGSCMSKRLPFLRVQRIKIKKRRILRRRRGLLSIFGR
jgi:hypothetical protein